MSKTGSVGSSFGGSGVVDSSVAGGVGCSFSDGTAVSGRRSDSSVFFQVRSAVVALPCCGHADRDSVVWVSLSDTLAGNSAARLSVCDSVLWGRSTSVFFSA